jgi:hypothetical protein
MITIGRDNGTIWCHSAVNMKQLIQALIGPLLRPALMNSRHFASFDDCCYSFRRSATQASRHNGTTKTALLRETWRMYCNTCCTSQEMVAAGDLKMTAACLGC